MEAIERGDRSHAIHYENMLIVQIKVIEKLMDWIVGSASLSTETQCRGNISVIEYLLRNGADIHAQDFRGNTYLHYSAENGNKGMTDFLLNLGCNVHVRNDEGLKPFHIALLGCNYEVIPSLCKEHLKKMDHRTDDKNQGDLESKFLVMDCHDRIKMNYFLLSLYPNDHAVHYELAASYFQAGIFPLAELAFDRAIALDPDNSDVIEIENISHWRADCSKCRGLIRGHRYFCQGLGKTFCQKCFRATFSELEYDQVFCCPSESWVRRYLQGQRSKEDQAIHVKMVKGTS